MISVGIPTSVVVNEPGLLLKTIIIHRIIRYTSIFGVDELVFYNDGFTPKDLHHEASRLIEKIWRYLLTPPYLRRKLIPKDPDLRYVGILYPLRLNIFDVSSKPVPGEKRLAYIYRSHGKLYADVGGDKPYRVEHGECRENEVSLIEIIDVNAGTAACIEDHSIYRGPILGFEDSLLELVEYYRSRRYHVLATSRYGRVPCVDELQSISRSGKLLVLFGSPRHGLYDIARRNKVKLEEIADTIWNTAPGQRVKTIRTEEALIITLGILNMFRYV